MLAGRRVVLFVQLLQRFLYVVHKLVYKIDVKQFEVKLARRRQQLPELYLI